MGHMWGDFTPTEEYNQIKKEVQYFFGSVHRDFDRWYSLRFNVQLENGYFILPVGGYEIYDHPELPDEPLEFHIAGAHSHIFEDYFENKKEFLIEPWHTISIEQKIDFEDELIREIGETMQTISALAKHRLKDEVLFAIHGGNVPPFVIGQLKPGQKMTIEEVFTEENYFDEFDDFINKRMIPDNASLGNS